MVIDDIRTDIEAIANNTMLFEEANFSDRADAIDDLEVHVFDRIASLQAPHPSEALIPLQQSAEQLQRQLEAVNAALFERLRADIRSGCVGAPFKTLITTYLDLDADIDQEQDHVGYDYRDVFIQGLLHLAEVPSVSEARGPELIGYQPAPARIMFELAEKAQFTKDDVFYDIGSGFGYVPIVIHLLSNVSSRGIEYEPAYCEYARKCAEALNLSQVAFFHADARAATYSEGTVFFMHTPFLGSVLQEVLDKLREESRRRTIKLFSCGPCTPHVSTQDWLERINNGDGIDKLAIFKSR